MACVFKRDPARCQGQVFVSLFFDGTGNNKDWKEPGLGCTQAEANKHSNVARLYDARVDKPEEASSPTTFRASARHSSKLATMAARSGWGPDFGAPIAFTGRFSVCLIRCTSNLTQEPARSQNHVMRAVVSGMSYDPNDPMRKLAFKTLGEQTGESGGRPRAQGHADQCRGVRILSRRRRSPRIRPLAVRISCAERWASTGWLALPIRIHFMGLFDTVAAVGIPDGILGADGHGSWGAHMAIHPAIEQCVHFIALHEQRGSFPLEMARGKQVAYPGMHSDVGGGYRPGDQGKAMPDWGLSPQLSRDTADRHAPRGARRRLCRCCHPMKSRRTPASPGPSIAPPDLIATVNDFYATWRHRAKCHRQAGNASLPRGAYPSVPAMAQRPALAGPGAGATPLLPAGERRTPTRSTCVKGPRTLPPPPKLARGDASAYSRRRPRRPEHRQRAARGCRHGSPAGSTGSAGRPATKRAQAHGRLHPRLAVRVPTHRKDGVHGADKRLLPLPHLLLALRRLPASTPTCCADTARRPRTACA